MVKILPLTRGYQTFVDDEDYEELSRWCWYAHVNPAGNVYAKRSVQVPREGCSRAHIVISMQSQIMALPVGDLRIVDHIDGDSLNNRRSNLRIASKKQNGINTGMSSRNTSGVKGVYWDKSKGKWHAQIGVDGRVIYLGRYDDLEEATRVRQEAEIKFFGEYRRKIRRDVWIGEIT